MKILLIAAAVLAAQIDSGLRGLAIEWLVSFVEKRLDRRSCGGKEHAACEYCPGVFSWLRAKFLSKSAPDFINLTLECCRDLVRAPVPRGRVKVLHAKA